MSENFSELFQQSLENNKMRSGDIVKGTVIRIDDRYVVINVGLKSEGTIPVEQFAHSDGSLEVNVGDEVDVSIEMPVDDFGETRLSREKAKRAQSWLRLVKSHEDGETVIGLITGRVKGGFTVEVDGVRAFLPGSLVDVRPIHDSIELEGKEFDFKIIKVDEKRNNIVVSRRAILEEENSAERSKLLDNLEEGQVVKGVVKNLTDYGAFIDLGGVDGLLHITDIAWKRIRLPSDVLKIGDEIEVVVLKFDKDRSRVSLGLKQLNKDPWSDIKTRYPKGAQLTGKVTNLTDYGCFVEIEEGVEGLVHMSEMDWTNKNIHPSKIVQVGDEVQVMILDIDGERRRISLGMKQCVSNPWESFSSKYQKGSLIVGTIKSITDFGIFIGLEGSIDGLVHLSDISWNEPGEQAIRNYKKGDEIEVVILGIDSDRERISLGVKQLQDDVFGSYVEQHPKGTIVAGKVSQVEEKELFIELTSEVEGRIQASEISTEQSADIRESFNVGDEIEAKVIGVNNKDCVLNLSIRAKFIKDDEASMSEEGGREEMVNPTLGDLLKQQIEGGEAQGEE